MNTILDIKETLDEDESIVNYQYYHFSPETGSQLNTPGNITITVQNSDSFFHPSASWLEFEGQVRATDETLYTGTSLISFVNFGILFLFDQLKCLLSGSPIETVFQPGIVANILGLATFPDNFKQGLIETWCPDTSTEIASTNKGFEERRNFILVSAPDPMGGFRISVPLKRLFGFHDDYGKVLYGFVQSLVLTRSSSDNNALCHKPWATVDKRTGDEVKQGKVHLEKIRWILPRVTPSDVAKYNLLKQVKDQVILSCGFRMRQHIQIAVPESNTFTWRLGVKAAPEQPRWGFLAFQTDKSNQQSKLNTVFDHCKLNSAHITLNTERYPLNDFETDFGKNHFDHFYDSFINFRKKFYGIDNLISSTNVGFIDYKTLFPIFCFDLRRQSERLKTGVTDITLECRFGDTVPAKTIAYCVLISDRKLKFKSDGEKLSLLY